MNYNQQETFTKLKANKTLDITTKSKTTFLTKISSMCKCIFVFFIWLKNSIICFLANRSILIQFILILIPFSLVIIFAIFAIHIYFYQDLYLFNFYKGVKEEFIDYYITEMDDMQSEIDIFVTKENYIDSEDQLFFEIYYKELASIGVLDNSNQKFFPNIAKFSETLYYDIGKNDKMDSSNKYTIPSEKAKKYIDEREGDSIGEFTKLYYYMFPIIAYGAFKMNIFFTAGFFIAYEFDKNRKISNNELFFQLPKELDNFNGNDNFVPSNNLINPLVSKEPFKHTELISDSYYYENWFMEQDSKFRQKIDLNLEGYSEISLSHLNYENEGNINKSFVISSQQNINRNNRHYIFNIIFFFDQEMPGKDDNNQYSSFIIKEKSNVEKEKEKYSDNETYVILKSDITEYSLINYDYQYFHYGLYNKNYNFFANGISYDSFNLDDLFDPLKYYSSIEDFYVDLKYLSTLYLYKTLFQTIKFTKIKRNREETYILNFNEEEKVKQICGQINFDSYNEYISHSDINCLESQNSIYFDEEYYQQVSMANIDSKYPYCSCLPLYCLNDFKQINDNYKYDPNNLASKISLPNKCQNKFIFYSNENKSISSTQTNININSTLNALISSSIKIPNIEYIRFQLEELNQLPGYYLLVLAKIQSNTEIFEYYFYTSEILYLMGIFVFLILFIASIISIIIIYVNLSRYSKIIKDFKKNYEIFVFHTDDGNLNISNRDNKNLYLKNGDENKLEKQSFNNENLPYSQLDNMGNGLYNDNENVLLDDLFTIFCKHYKLSRNEIEKYYSKQKHETKYQMKLKMMTEKNELFKLLTMLSVYAPIFRLNLNLDYKMYKYSKIIKKYDQYVTQVVNIDKDQARLTKNILYELLSTENISDYGLISNLNFKYITNIKAELKENSIQNAMFINVINKMKGKNDDMNESELNVNDVFFFLKDGDEKKNIKLILKKKNELMEYLKFKFESDDYINYNRVESSFNFFLVNSYTTGLAPGVLSYMLSSVIVPRLGGTVQSREVGLPVSASGLILPCGAAGRWSVTA